ncbi:MAG: hypothetical protein ACPG5B_12055 [Chitinophagales bacterium]
MNIYFTALFLLLFGCSNIFAQNKEVSEPKNKFKKNSLFVNIGYVLNPENQAYALLYKRNSKRKALRLGFTSTYRSTSSKSQQSGNYDNDWLDNKLIIGFEKQKHFDKWQYNYGVDFSPSLRVNWLKQEAYDPMQILGLGLTINPFWGAMFQVHEKISLGAELQLPVFEYWQQKTSALSNYAGNDVDSRQVNIGFVPQAALLVAFNF